MYRGTTPKLIFKGGNCVQLKNMAEIWLTIKGWEKELTLKLTENVDRMVIDEDENTLEVTLTQEETLDFKAKEVKAQLRFLDNSGIASASKVTYITMDDVIKDGVIA